MTTAACTPRSGAFWAWVPVGLLLASLTGVGGISLIASRDPSFALEKNYYARAVRWDAEQAQWAENERLGYHVDLSVRSVERGSELRVKLADRRGRLLHGASVRVEAFANARAAEQRELALGEVSDGTYTAPLGAARPGLWEFRVSVHVDGKRFTSLARADVPRETPQ